MIRTEHHLIHVKGSTPVSRAKVRKWWRIPETASNLLLTGDRRPSKQSMLDPYGYQMGFCMGPVRAPHMGAMWDLQQGSMLGPHGCSMWVQYGPRWGPI